MKDPPGIGPGLERQRKRHLEKYLGVGETRGGFEDLCGSSEVAVYAWEIDFIHCHGLAFSPVPHLKLILKIWSAALLPPVHVAKRGLQGQHLVHVISLGTRGRGGMSETYASV